jgi:hypothetical protein
VGSRSDVAPLHCSRLYARHTLFSINTYKCMIQVCLHACIILSFYLSCASSPREGVWSAAVGRAVGERNGCETMSVPATLVLLLVPQRTHARTTP